MVPIDALIDEVRATGDAPVTAIEFALNVLSVIDSRVADGFFSYDMYATDSGNIKASARHGNDLSLDFHVYIENDSPYAIGVITRTGYPMDKEYNLESPMCALPMLSEILADITCDKRPFSFCVVKYIHDHVANEAINIGVILYSENALQACINISSERLSRVFAGFSVASYDQCIRSMLNEMLTWTSNNIASMLARLSDMYRGSFIEIDQKGCGLSSDMDLDVMPIYNAYVASQSDTKDEYQRIEIDAQGSRFVLHEVAN